MAPSAFSETWRKTTQVTGALPGVFPGYTEQIRVRADLLLRRRSTSTETGMCIQFSLIESLSSGAESN